MTNLNWFHTEPTNKAKSLVAEAIGNNQYTDGPHTKKLELELSKILGTPFCVYTNSGTSALSIALLAAGADHNKTVDIPGIGWIATVQAAQMTGAAVRIVDVCKDLPILDCSKLSDESDIIIPVNYNGRQVDINKIRSKNPGSIIIEDSCKSLFSKGFNGHSLSGSMGDFGCYSLGMISALPGIYGGIVTAQDVKLKELIKIIKWHGTSYLNDNETYESRSFNFKSSNLHAAYALGMLENYEDRLKNLISVYTMYENGLRGLTNSHLIPVNISRGEVPLLIDIVSKDRPKHLSKLREMGIPTCNYHASLSLAPGVSYEEGCANSYFFANSTYHPPCGPDQDPRLIDMAIKTIRSFG